MIPQRHWHQFRGATIRELHNINGIGWSDVVVRLQIASGVREVVQAVDFAPRAALGEASVHIAIVYGKGGRCCPCATSGMASLPAASLPMFMCCDPLAIALTAA